MQTTTSVGYHTQTLASSLSPAFLSLLVAVCALRRHALRYPSPLCAAPSHLRAVACPLGQYDAGLHSSFNFSNLSVFEICANNHSCWTLHPNPSFLSLPNLHLSLSLLPLVPTAVMPNAAHRRCVPPPATCVQPPWPPTASVSSSTARHPRLSHCHPGHRRRNAQVEKG